LRNCPPQRHFQRWRFPLALEIQFDFLHRLFESSVDRIVSAVDPHAAEGFSWYIPHVVRQLCET
jgi:hypothetical protein